MHYYALNGFKWRSAATAETICYYQLQATVLWADSLYQNRFSQKRSTPKTCEETVRQTIQFFRNEKNALIRRAARNPDVELWCGADMNFIIRSLVNVILYGQD